jgi:hypothetical protein
MAKQVAIRETYILKIILVEPTASTHDSPRLALSLQSVRTGEKYLFESGIELAGFFESWQPPISPIEDAEKEDAA